MEFLSEENLEASSPHARKAEEGDVDFIWQIRNHPQIRKTSLEQEEIPLQRHRDWFSEKYLQPQSENFCFVLRAENRAIGYCRFDLDEEQQAFRVSIALEPSYHGRGMGFKFLSSSLAELQKTAQGTTRVAGEIQKNNVASLRLFEKAGFHITDEDNEKVLINLNLETHE